MNLNAVEEEIRKAEAYLQSDLLSLEGPSDESLSKKEVTVERRQEILEQLQQERRCDTDTDDSKSNLNDKMAVLNVGNDDHDFSVSEKDKFESNDPEKDMLQAITGEDDRVYFASDLDAENENIQEHIAAYRAYKEKEILIKNDIKSSSPAKPLKLLLPRETKTTIIRKQAAAKHKPKTSPKNECTFKPKITPYHRTKQYTTGKKRIQELSQSREAEFAKRERTKMQHDLESLKNCTFKPRVNKSNSSVEVTTEDAVPSVIDRLHAERERKERVRVEKKQALDEHDLAQYTFQPKINPATAAIIDMETYQPIQDRIPELQREKDEHMMHLKQAIDEEERKNHRFVPRINATSKRIASVRKKQDDAEMNLSNDPVTTRLIREADRAKEKKMRAQEQADREAAEKHNFKPRLTLRTKAIIEEKPEFKTEFLERQEILQEQNAQRTEKKLLYECATDPCRAPCTFVPHIGNAERILECTGSSQLDETQEERSRRLSCDDSEMIRERKDKISGDYYSQFTYRPKINALSQTIGRSTTLEELVSNDRTKKIRADAVMAVQDARNQECSFRPKINASSRRAAAGVRHKRPNLADSKNVLKEIESYRAQRESQLEAAQRNAEYEELKGCTFQPKINRKKRKENQNGNAAKTPSGVVIVRGLGSFLERQAKIKKMQAEKEARENEVFGAHKRYRKRTCTVPRPFELSFQKNNQKAKHAALAAKVREEEMKECTFHPQTMEKANRELIQNLLDTNFIDDDPTSSPVA